VSNSEFMHGSPAAAPSLALLLKGYATLGRTFEPAAFLRTPSRKRI